MGERCDGEAMVGNLTGHVTDRMASAVERCRDCATRATCLGAGLDGPELAVLPQLLTCSELLPESTHLFRAGDLADCHYHVRSGMLKSYTINAEGDESVTGFYLPGEIMGSAQSQGVHTHSAMTLETASVCRLKVSDIPRLDEIDRLSGLFVQIAEHQTRLYEHQELLSITSAQTRFTGFCLRYSERLARLGRSEHFLPTPMSRTDIASYLGMTLESLSRVTSRLNKARLIRTSRDHIEILDIETLRTVAV
jgi:CRP/FNR family transcriptional regulator